MDHWKSSTNDLSKSTIELEKQRDELKASFDAMQDKMNKERETMAKEIMSLKLEVIELKKDKPAVMNYIVQPPSEELLKNPFVENQQQTTTDYDEVDLEFRKFNEMLNS